MGEYGAHYRRDWRARGARLVRQPYRISSDSQGLGVHPEALAGLSFAAVTGVVGEIPSVFSGSKPFAHILCCGIVGRGGGCSEYPQYWDTEDP